LNSPFKVYASLRSAQNKRPLDVCSAPHHPPTVQGLRGATVGAKRMVYISFRSVQNQGPPDLVHPPDIQRPTIRRFYFFISLRSTQYRSPLDLVDSSLHIQHIMLFIYLPSVIW